MQEVAELKARIEQLEAALRASRLVLIERGIDPKSRIVRGDRHRSRPEFTARAAGERRRVQRLSRQQRGLGIPTPLSEASAV